ncbi:hypothetical protein ANCCAN_26410 [Ancylostoma caninum]|uniref:Uncharacterized protein n=1 Tax=Ancylostoma caninum TaxID=29170 RepID=A0A368F6Z0_ANCCA|nr:hypothetical protein ANCCAN_26410 [Ancylostoma caninum]
MGLKKLNHSIHLVWSNYLVFIFRIHQGMGYLSGIRKHSLCSTKSSSSSRSRSPIHTRRRSRSRSRSQPRNPQAARNLSVNRVKMTAHGDELGPEKLDIQLTQIKKV